MSNVKLYPDDLFWSGKRVFVTGHTGFKGGWISKWLISLGAEVVGYSLRPYGDINFFDLTKLEGGLQNSYFADIRDLEDLRECLIASAPEVVIHMAAQSLVRYSYSNPVITFETNVMGTVNILEAIRNIASIKSVIIVTSDKCYENSETGNPFSETDRMGGKDPYSCSKGCAELVTEAYRGSFFSNSSSNTPLIATVRAGNVIGGGDWSEDRLVPDALRAYADKKELVIRSPNSTRPWQHVLDPICGYLMIAKALYLGRTNFSGAWNFGPNIQDILSVIEIVKELEVLLKGGLKYKTEVSSDNFIEAKSLTLSCDKAINKLGWQQRVDIRGALKLTAQWNEEWILGSDMSKITLSQITNYSQAQ